MALDPDRPGRIRCSVIGCNRTAPASKYEPGTRICCGKCWRLGALVYRQHYRRSVKAGQIGEAHLAWDAIVKQVTEARGGI